MQLVYSIYTVFAATDSATDSTATFAVSLYVKPQRPEFFCHPSW